MSQHEPYASMNGRVMGNPSASENAIESRYGGIIGTFFKPHMGGAVIKANMSMPTDRRMCSAMGNSSHADVIVRAPSGVTGYNLNIGRYCLGRAWTAKDGATDVSSDLDGVLPVVQDTINVTATGQMDARVIETRGLPIAIWIDNINGTVGGGESFAIWTRGFDG